MIFRHGRSTRGAEGLRLARWRQSDAKFGEMTNMGYHMGHRVIYLLEYPPVLDLEWTNLGRYRTKGTHG